MQYIDIKQMKGKALRKHSLHKKTAASVLLKLLNLKYYTQICYKTSIHNFKDRPYGPGIFYILVIQMTITHFGTITPHYAVNLSQNT